MAVIPRAPPASLKGRMSLKTPWDFFKSVFKDYRADTEKLLDDCFEIDWALTKCEKIIKGPGESDKAKAYLKSIYKHIREVYKYYAGIAPSGRVFSIGPGTLTEIMNQCEDFVDHKAIKISDIDLGVIACNGGMRVTNWLNPEKNLVRYQMLEVLSRLSIDKYYKTGTCPTISEAIIMTSEKHFKPYFEQFDCHKFRKERLWREEIDILYTRFFDGLKTVYAKNTGRFAMPGMKNTPMSLDEFVDMFVKAELVDDHFGQREIGPMYNLA